MLFQVKSFKRFLQFIRSQDICWPVWLNWPFIYLILSLSYLICRLYTWLCRHDHPDFEFFCAWEFTRSSQKRTAAQKTTLIRVRNKNVALPSSQTEKTVTDCALDDAGERGQHSHCTAHSFRSIGCCPIRVAVGVTCRAKRAKLQSSPGKERFTDSGCGSPPTNPALSALAQLVQIVLWGWGSPASSLPSLSPEWGLGLRGQRP